MLNSGHLCPLQYLFLFHYAYYDRLVSFLLSSFPITTTTMITANGLVLLLLHERIELPRHIYQVIRSTNSASILATVAEYICACDELLVKHYDYARVRLSNNCTACSERDVVTLC